MRILPVCILLISFATVLSSCTFNATVIRRGLGGSIGSDTLVQKIFIDITNVTMTEGSVAIINVAVNPVRDQDTVVNLDLAAVSSGYVRFNPIPSQIIIAAGSTSKSVVLNTIDDSLIQDQEIWKFSISSADASVRADPGILSISLNDNDGGIIPGTPMTLPTPKLLKEFNAYPTAINKINFKGKVYYSGSDGANGTELWVTDGTLYGSKLFKDIENGLDSSNPANFFIDSTNTYLYFTATTSSEGLEVWRTDGTENGTILLKDFEPGAVSSGPVIKYSLNGKTIITAQTTLEGPEVYVTDGTYAGTLQLLNNNPGVGGNSIQSQILYRGELYFSNQDTALYTTSIWKTDGTSAGTSKLVSRTASGEFISNYPQYLQNIINDKILFQGRGSYGYELYVTEGTEATTFLLKDIRAGSLSSYATALPHTINTMQIVGYIYDDTGTQGYYITDGTPAGTVKITQPISTGAILGKINGKIIYSGCVTSECELYETAGLSNDAVLIKDMFPGNNGSGNPNNGNPVFAAQIGNNIFYTATSADGLELWVTDGTSAGTVMLKDIYLGALGSSPSNFIVMGNELLFTARSSSFGHEIWITNGTAAGTLLYKDLLPGTTGSGANNLLAVNGTHLFFTAYNSASQFASIFISELATREVLVMAHALVETLNSETKNLVELNGLVYFDAMSGNGGNPLWATDGTSANTVKIKDLYPNIVCSDINYMTVMNGSLFFLASTEASGSEIHISDGTTAGTQVLKELGAGTAGASIGAGLIVNNFGKMFFSSGGDAAVGTELYVSNGTSAGTQLVKDIVSGAAGSLPIHITALPSRDEVVFITSSGGYSYYVSDGTSVGTVQLSGITNINYPSYPPIATLTGAFIHQVDNTNLRAKIYFLRADDNSTVQLNPTYTTDIVVGTLFYNPTLNLLFYLTTDSTNTTLNLWKSNGTTVGTSLIKNIPITGTNFQVSFLGNLAGKTIFQYNNNTSSPYVRELWITDGTTAGTLVLDSAPNTTGATYSAGIEFGGQYYFSKFETSTGSELWKTDGTVINTKMVKDINPGTTSSAANSFVPYNGKLYFIATDDASGAEVWRTDGTLLGTQLLYDINPGKKASSPTMMKVLAGKLYFLAVKVLSGREIWVYSE